jgi:hypothetical protein
MPAPAGVFSADRTEPFEDAASTADENRTQMPPIVVGADCTRRLRDAYQKLMHSGVADALTAAEARLLLQDAASDVPNGNDS